MANFLKNLNIWSSVALLETQMNKAVLIVFNRNEGLEISASIVHFLKEIIFKALYENSNLFSCLKLCNL